MRRTYRFDRELDCLVEVGGNSNYFEPEAPRSANVISDDVGAGVNGLRHMPSGKMLDSKSAHRRENRARGLEEVGTSTDFASRRERPHADYYGQIVKDSADQIRGNYQGTADRLARENEQRRR